MVVYKTGDILKSDAEVIVHGCNCKNNMGAGIAVQIKQRFPRAWAEDQKTVWGDVNKLGNFTFVSSFNEYGHTVVIVNAYTQYNYTAHEVDVDYDALEEAMERICEMWPDKVISMPRIGCGLAGGDWEVVEEILSRISDKHDMTFNVYTL